jgi:CheY-like chemotaxis protein
MPKLQRLKRTNSRKRRYSNMHKNMKRQNEQESKSETATLPTGANVCLENGLGIEIEDFTKKPTEVRGSQKSTLSEEKAEEIFITSEHKLRILVVDDNKDIREMLEDFLNFEGHKPVLAKDGKEAFEIFCGQDFDIVITDLGMPGMSGWELSKSIKQKKPGIPVVIITGWGAQLGAEELKKNKVEWILSKPFNLDQVKQMIEMVGTRISLPCEGN